jgi:hypothetical protein
VTAIEMSSSSRLKPELTLGVCFMFLKIGVALLVCQ